MAGKPILKTQMLVGKDIGGLIEEAGDWGQWWTHVLKTTLFTWGELEGLKGKVWDMVRGLCAGKAGAQHPTICLCKASRFPQ